MFFKDRKEIIIIWLPYIITTILISSYLIKILQKSPFIPKIRNEEFIYLKWKKESRQKKYQKAGNISFLKKEIEEKKGPQLEKTFTLTTIISVKKQKACIINGKIYYEGYKLTNNIKIFKIKNKSVILKVKNKYIEVKLGETIKI
ncbi:hypothetical protein [Thermodesulfatator atlanticus]